MDVAAYVGQLAYCRALSASRVAELLHHLDVRVAAGAFGFVIFTQSGEHPDWYGRSRRLATMPSRPMRHACRNTISPSAPLRC